ncbi:unnamed protein product [Phytomonas sp. Hart1]|nr:unnamed protein product [Phytomonas sp. Hart1]|eukprot:CCW69081.1 unnamed protein product [Phytomonas sp. isolate Hart1]
MSSPLLAQVPTKWTTIVRPFLLRADEFAKQHPVVSYFLRTHVAYLCMKNRTKDKEDLKFLKQLLGDLENDKRLLGKELENVDGRTVLTKYALMLFSKADTDERSGKADLNIVRLFFTSALLFEATIQFTEDAEMDPIAKEKCKYAKYTAACMKKAVDNNNPYISRNRIEETPSQETSFLPDERLRNEVGEDQGSISPLFFPNHRPLPPSASPVDEDFQNAIKFNDGGSVSPILAPPPYVSPVNSKPVQFKSKGIPSGGVGITSTMKTPVESQFTAMTEVFGNAEDADLSLDAILDAQKSVSQAVTALQFNDSESARKLLRQALEFLDQ